MFGRVDQLKIREMIEGWDALLARVSELEKRKTPDPLEELAKKHVKVTSDDAKNAGSS